LHAFNHLSSYAPEFVSTESKKIASFKRGFGSKLLKTMGHTKCATFNEFVSDALTQENYNTVYTATKTCKQAFEFGAGASQSKALVAARPQYHAPTPNTRYRPLAKKNQVKTGFRKGYSIALPRGNTGPSYAKTPLPTIRAGTVIRQGIGKATVLTRQRRATKGTSIRGVFTTQQSKLSLWVR